MGKLKEMGTGKKVILLIVALTIVLVGVAITMEQVKRYHHSSDNLAVQTRQAAKEQDAHTAYLTGKSAYNEGNFPKAEAYWKRAVELEDDSQDGDERAYAYRNDVALALLQQEDDEEAYGILSDLYGSIWSPRYRGSEYQQFCIMLNYMVAAHACGKPSTSVQDAGTHLQRLRAMADAEPGENTQLLLAIYYNAIYMDMELDVDAFRAGHFDYSGIGLANEDIDGLLNEGGVQAVTARVLELLGAEDRKVYGDSRDDPDMEKLGTYSQGLRTLGQGAPTVSPSAS